MKLSRLFALSCLAVVPVLVPATASAQFSKAEDAVDYRQSALSVMAEHFGRIAPVARGQKPFNAAEVQADVAIVATMAKLPWSAFGPGTEGGKARPEVWKDNAKFVQASQDLQANVAKLQTAAQSGEVAQLRTAFGAVGASCKACHDNFRAK